MQLDLWRAFPHGAVQVGAPFPTHGGSGLYYGVQFVLIFGALVMLGLHTRREPADELVALPSAPPPTAGLAEARRDAMPR